MDFELTKKVVLEAMIPDPHRPVALSIFNNFKNVPVAVTNEGIQEYIHNVEKYGTGQVDGGLVAAAAINGLILGVLLSKQSEDTEVFKLFLEREARKRGENIVEFKRK